MSRKKSPTKKSGVLEPVYALLGATEMATGALRKLGAEGEEVGKVQSATRVPMLARLKGDVADIARGAGRVPGLAAGEAQARYAELAQRGQQTVSGLIPVVAKARQESAGVAKAEEAKARREARRLARQAGATVTRGKTIATQAAGDTVDAVRAEAEQVVEAVTHPGRIKSRPTRRSATLRRSTVSDTAVTSTSPVGGDPDARPDVVGAGGVEAAAATIGRRSPRGRRTAPGTVTDSTSVVAKKAKATRQDDDAPATASQKTFARDTPEISEGSETPVSTDAHGARHDHSEIPTPADVAKAVESSQHDG